MKTLKWFGLMVLSYLGVILSIPFIPIQITYRLSSSKYDLWYYFKQIAIANDVTIGSNIYGSRHTLSAITGYRDYLKSKWHKYQAKVIDFWFCENHCRDEAIDEGLI